MSGGSSPVPGFRSNSEKLFKFEVNGAMVFFSLVEKYKLVRLNDVFFGDSSAGTRISKQVRLRDSGGKVCSSRGRMPCQVQPLQKYFQCDRGMDVHKESTRSVTVSDIRKHRKPSCGNIKETTFFSKEKVCKISKEQNSKHWVEKRQRSKY